MRFEVTLTTENTPPGNNTAFAIINQSVSVAYGFCPVVDQLQVLNLSDSATYSAGNRPFRTLSTLTNKSYVSVYGMGPRSNFLYPSNESDSMAVIMDRHPDCPQTQPLAIVRFLVLNVTVTNGRYNYGANGDQGVQIGFNPTCTVYDACLLSSGVCVGDRPGRRNCAQCVGNYTDLETSGLRIWTSYYGTDANGRPMMSGSSNPLAFQEYTVTPIYNTVANDVTSRVDNI